MLYTVKHARDLVSPFVLTGGSCPGNAVVLDRINEAQRRLLSEGKADWDSTQRHVQFCTQNGCVALPREFESARLVSLDGGPANIFPNSYRYLENGPGPEASSDHYGKDLEDLGDGWPTFFDMPVCADGLELFAVSTSIEDTNLTIQAFGRMADGSEILQDTGIPGFSLAIRHWADSTEGKLAGYPVASSAQRLSRVTQLILPAGRRAYVTLYAVNPTTHEMYFLSKFHPAETNPAYRRYRILGAGCDCDTCVIMLAKIRHVPLVRDDDVLLIQNLDALKTMVMAIREENAGNVSASVALEEKANQQLARQLANKRSGDPIVQVQDIFAVGSSVNLI